MSRESELRAAFQALIDQVKRAPVVWETGVCCCGDPMEGHSIWDNHSPRDEGEYFYTTIIQDAERALEQ